MREDCKFFQRRSFRSGDVASFCALGLAPEAPWRCPDDCRRYQRRIDDGSPSAAGSAADGLGRPEEPELASGVADVLGSAEEIIGSLAPELAAEQRRRERAQREAEDSWWNRLRRSSRWRR